MRKLAAVFALLLIPVLSQAQVWTATGSLASPRLGHSATMLWPSGKVLVAGGSAFITYPPPPPPSTSAEVYDAATGAWTPTSGAMVKVRTDHKAVLLPGGKVLVVGGRAYVDPGYLVPIADAEIYDPTAASASWAPTAAMLTARAGNSATLLPDGRVLVAGGIGPGGTVLNTAEVFEPAAKGTWKWTSITAAMRFARYDHAAVLLPDGRVRHVHRRAGEWRSAQQRGGVRPDYRNVHGGGVDERRALGPDGDPAAGEREGAGRRCRVDVQRGDVRGRQDRGGVRPGEDHDAVVVDGTDGDDAVGARGHALAER